MTITRNGVKITLTDEELSQAYDEFVTNFMMNELMNDFHISDEKTARSIADHAYNIYCKGDGKTEYECIECAYYEYEKDIKPHLLLEKAIPPNGFFIGEKDSGKPLLEKAIFLKEFHSK